MIDAAEFEADGFRGKDADPGILLARGIIHNPEKRDQAPQFILQSKAHHRRIDLADSFEISNKITSIRTGQRKFEMPIEMLDNGIEIGVAAFVKIGCGGDRVPQRRRVKAAAGADIVLAAISEIRRRRMTAGAALFGLIWKSPKENHSAR